MPFPCNLCAKNNICMGDDGFTPKMQHTQGYAPDIAKTMPQAFERGKKYLASL